MASDPTPNDPPRTASPQTPQAARSIAGWILARKLIQSLALMTFVVLFIASRRGGWQPGLTNLLMRLDPLLTISHLLASRTFLAGSVVSVLLLLLTIVLGRAWCGWLCPLGTIFDLFPSVKWRKRGKVSQQNSLETRLEPWRNVKYGLLLLILFAALFGNLTLLVLDPLTILFRTLTTSLWPALDAAITTAETYLYQLPLFSNLITVTNQGLRPTILPSEPVYYREIILFAAFFVAILILNQVAHRFWCRYLCPLGALLGLFSKVAIFRREVGESCKGCTLCTRTCPTGTINPAKSYASDPSECTMCLECMQACPRNGIEFTSHLAPALWNEYDPSRRQALISMGAAVAAVALLRSDALMKRETPFLIRPPGARENNLLSKCIRCAECMRACPTSAIQPSLGEAGLEGIWTPVLIPRLGYCDYSCNACGQACPVQAIPPLALEEKRNQVIGKAYIDQNRCIAWSDHRPCIVCEEMCPIPDKAIVLQEIQVMDENRESITIQMPFVIRDLCIGCGICEYKCPVNGEAAIRVWVPGTEVPF